MKYRIKLSISQSLFAIFAFMVISIIILVVYTFINFNKVRYSNQYLYDNYWKGLEGIKELQRIVHASNGLLFNWLLTEKDTASYTYKEYFRLIDTSYYELKAKIWSLVDYWPIEFQNSYYRIIDYTDTLIIKQKQIFSMLEFPEDLNNTQIILTIYAMTSEKGELKNLENKITEQIKQLYIKLNADSRNYILKIDNNMKIYRRFIGIGVFLFMVIILFIVFLLVNKITVNINRINNLAERLSKGELISVPYVSKRDELGIFYKNLRDINDYLKRTSEFALNLSNSKFDVDFSPAGKADVLSNSLLKLRDSLKQAQHIAHLRELENKHREWSSQGIAEFAELLREHSRDLDTLSRVVIAKLVKYTDSQVGAIYIVNDEDKNNIFIEAKAFYAYNRYIHRKTRFKPGEGLIGECYIEAKTIFMDNVPKDYLIIESGLGADRPRSLLIVPLIINEQVMGIVEIASFEVYEPYKIEFVEKIGETIASAISTVKINIRTERLLQETQRKSKELEQKEAESAEKIEKMQRTIQELKRLLGKEKKKSSKNLDKQKELERKLIELRREYENMLRKKELEINNLLFAINETIGYYVLSYNGDFLDVNSLYLSFLKLDKDQVLATKHQRFLGIECVNTGAYKKLWDEIKLGKTVKTSIQYMIEGKVHYVNEVFTPILNEKGTLEKVIVFSFVS